MQSLTNVIIVTTILNKLPLSLLPVPLFRRRAVLHVVCPSGVAPGEAVAQLLWVLGIIMSTTVLSPEFITLKYIKCSTPIVKMLIL